MEDTKPESYWIPESNRSEVEVAFAKLAKKAAKLGMAPITFTVIGTEERAGKKVEDVTGKVVTVFNRWLNVIISGEQPKIAGWVVTAALDHLEDGNLLREAPGVTGIPAIYRTAKPVCEHCNVSRRRHSTFVLRAESDGSYKQVGRQCLRDFLGHENPEQVIAYFELLRTAADLCEGGESEGSGGWGKGDLLHTEEFLNVVAAVIRIEGWASRKVSRETDGKVRATANIVSSFFDPPMGSSPSAAEERAFLRQFAPTDADKETATKAIAWAKAIPDTEESDYLWNCRLSAGGEYLTAKQYGVAASIVQAYLREVGKAAQRLAYAQANAGSRHLGAVGERLDLDVLVTDIISRDSEWGTTHIHKLITKDGCLLTWFGTAAPLETGKEYRIAATVKKHDVFREVKQTVVTRVSVWTEEGIRAAAEKAAKKAARETKKLAKLAKAATA